MRTPQHINSLELEATCVWINIYKWDELMEGHTRANKNLIDQHIKEHLPELYEGLSLNLRNPYFYHKTKRHLIMVHSGIEYFLLFT